MTHTSTSASGTELDRHDVGFTVSHYDLTLDYRVATNRLDAVAVVTANATEDLAGISLELASLKVTEVLVNGRRPARWRHQRGLMTVRLAAPLRAHEEFAVTVRYGGKPGPLLGPWGDVGWEELADGVLVAGQPDGAASWFPCHNSPADKAAFRITVTAESLYTVVCNGRLVSRTALSARERWVYEMAQPMSPYLATVQVGRYESFELASGPIRQVVFAPPKLRHAVMDDLARQPQMMDVFRDAFGPYPFVDYTVVVTDDVLEIPVEAQGLSVFGANHLDGTQTWERLVAHELAHQWFGNSLTVASWNEIWLHEGFACYAEWLWSHASGGETAHQQAVAAYARLAELPQDFLIGDPDADHMFDDRLYKRGALALHSLRLTVGEEPFFAVMRAWAAENRHGTVSTQGFIDTAQRMTSTTLGGLFAAWLETEELPPLPSRFAEHT